MTYLQRLRNRRRFQVGATPPSGRFDPTKTLDPDRATEYYLRWGEPTYRNGWWHWPQAPSSNWGPCGVYGISVDCEIWGGEDASAWDHVPPGVEDPEGDALVRQSSPVPQDALPAIEVPSEQVSQEVRSAPASAYPWNVRSGRTAELQRQINARLVREGYCAINPDGILGAKTCGGARIVGIAAPGTCRNYEDPDRCARPGLLSRFSMKQKIVAGATGLGVLFLLFQVRS